MLVGEEGLVSCRHQAVAEHPGYTATAYATDGTLEAMEAMEAMEAAGERFEVAVQWHPETRADAGLFSGLVAATVDRSPEAGRPARGRRIRRRCRTPPRVGPRTHARTG